MERIRKNMCIYQQYVKSCLYYLIYQQQQQQQFPQHQPYRAPLLTSHYYIMIADMSLAQFANMAMWVLSGTLTILAVVGLLAKGTRDTTPYPRRQGRAARKS